jgi:hypothetical protein
MLAMVARMVWGLIYNIVTYYRINPGALLSSAILGKPIRGLSWRGVTNSSPLSIAQY